MQQRIQAVVLKSPREIESMVIAGRLAAQCLAWIIGEVRPGITTQDLDDLQMQFARKHGVVPAPLGYKGFPKSLCTSVNEVICHGIPTPKQRLREGDIIGVDVTLIVDGFHGDNAATVPVGEIAPDKMQLIVDALEAQRQGVLAAAKPGARLGDIGHAIQSFAEPLGYGVVRDFTGHGTGRVFHEPPQILHFGQPGAGPRLKPGMTFTIEPMINLGTHRAVMLDDGWTAVTADGKWSAQFEHTMALTHEGLRVLTVQNDSGEWEPPGRWTPPVSAA